MAGKGPDLSGVGRKKSKAAIRQQIVYGSKVMPAFGDDLELEISSPICDRRRKAGKNPARLQFKLMPRLTYSRCVGNCFAQRVSNLPLLALCDAVEEWQRQRAPRDGLSE